MVHVRVEILPRFRSVLAELLLWQRCVLQGQGDNASVVVAVRACTILSSPHYQDAQYPHIGDSIQFSLICLSYKLAGD